jgi:hypothetical protein
MSFDFAYGNMSFARTFPALVLLLFISGCAAFSGYPDNYQDNAAVRAVDQPYLNANVRDIGNSPLDSARGGLTKQQYRDTVIYRRIEIIDVYYYDFESKLIGTYNGLDVGADLTVLVLNGLGATVGAASAKAALAAASAGVIGAKNTVNTDIFYQKTIPALVAQMRAAREKALLTIENGVARPVSSYSLDQALSDINGYYVAGSLPSAISQIVTQAGAAQAQATAGIDALRNQKYRTATSAAKKVIAWLYPNGDESKAPDAAKLAKLTAWMQKYKPNPALADLPFIQFLHGDDPSYDPALAQAVKDLVGTP